MKYSEYLPDVFREIEDYQFFGTAADDQLKRLWQQLDCYCKEMDLFAAEESLSRWEKIFSLSGEGKPLEERRRQILSRLNIRLPYTQKQLSRQLFLVFGGSDIDIDVDTAAFSLTIGIPDAYRTFPKELKYQLRQTIPANLVLNLYGLHREQCHIRCGVYLQTADDIVIEERRTEANV